MPKYRLPSVPLPVPPHHLPSSQPPRHQHLPVCSAQRLPTPQRYLLSSHGLSGTMSTATLEERFGLLICIRQQHVSTGEKKAESQYSLHARSSTNAHSPWPLDLFISFSVASGEVCGSFDSIGILRQCQVYRNFRW